MSKQVGKNQIFASKTYPPLCGFIELSTFVVCLQ